LRQLLEITAIVAIGFHILIPVQQEPKLRRKIAGAFKRNAQDVARWILRLRRSGRTDAL
jgi:hypothetical protein